MSKQSGLGDQLFVAGYDIGGDINTISNLSTPRETLPSTGITVFAQERMFGKRDGLAEVTSYWNVDSDRVFDAFSALPRTDAHLMYCRGEGIGNEAFCLVGKQIDYNPSRGDDGSLLSTTSVSAAAYGADWSRQLTAGKDTHASAASSTSLDTAASVSFGFQAYLQVFSIGSGTATVTIQDSANNTDWTNLTSGAFAAVTARGAQRIVSSSATAAVRRYLRVTTTGTFTDLVFAVAINKNAGARAL